MIHSSDICIHIFHGKIDLILYHLIEILKHANVSRNMDNLLSIKMNVAIKVKNVVNIDRKSIMKCYVYVSYICLRELKGPVHCRWLNITKAVQLLFSDSHMR